MDNTAVIFYLVKIEGLTGLYRVRLSGAGIAEEQLEAGGIEYAVARAGEFQLLVSFCIFEDLDVGGIPDIIATGDLFGKILNDLPVVVIVKFVAMTPNVKKPRRSRAILIKKLVSLFFFCFGYFVPIIGTVILA